MPYGRQYAALDYVRKNEMEKAAPDIYILPNTWEDRLYFGRGYYANVMGISDKVR